MIVALIILLCILLLCIMPVKVDVSYLLYKNENAFKIRAGVLFPFITVFDSSKKKKVKESSAEKEGNKRPKREINFEFIKEIMSHCAKLFAYFKKHLVIEKFKLHFHIGADEAALTGIATGAAWGALYDIAAVFDRNFKLKEKNIHVCPKFDGAIFETDINVRISIRFYNLLVFAGKTYKSLKELELI